MTANEPTLPPERVEELAEWLLRCRVEDAPNPLLPHEGDRVHVAHVVAPLIAGWLAEDAGYDLLQLHQAREQGAAEVRARVEAAIRLVSPDHITPMGARQILAALATEPEEQP